MSDFDAAVRDRRQKWAEAIWPGAWEESDLRLEEIDRCIALANQERAEALETFAGEVNTGDYGYGEHGSGWYERSAESVLRDAMTLAELIREGKK